MKIASSKPKNQRILKSVKLKIASGKKVRRPFSIEPIGENWWFCLRKGEWGPYNGEGGMTSSYYSMRSYGFNNVYSLKAAVRLIKKWNVPKGTKFIASLPFVGYDFIITK